MRPGRILGSLLGIFLFCLAIWVLHQELREYRLHDILSATGKIPSLNFLIALFLTFLNYWLLTFYETLGFRYIQRPLKYRKIGFASFIGYAFSNNMSFSALSGGSVVRYRLYSAWGLTALDIAKFVAFSSLTFMLGLFSLAGLVFMLRPTSLSWKLPFLFISVRPLGFILLGLVGIYLLFTALRKKPLRIMDWEFTIPSVRLSLAQIGLTCLDLVLSGSILYVLLPSREGIGYPSFLGVYLLAMLSGMVSQIPGGLGVFETAVVLLLPNLPASALVGSLVAYRGIYFLLPLGIASFLLGLHEFVYKGEQVRKIVGVFGSYASNLAPHLMSFGTFVGGSILLLSGAAPAEAVRLAWLRNLVPLPVVEVSHFLGSVAGVGLILLAWGLQRRINAAYVSTLGLLILGALFSLLKGVNYEGALILFLMFFAILPYRGQFYRKTSLLNEPFTLGWVTALTVVLISTVWFGGFSYKHVEYSDNLWWRFALFEEAPRFLRASVGAFGVALIFGLARLFRFARPRSIPLSLSELGRIGAIVERSRVVSANLSFLGDKRFLFSPAGNAFIIYGIQGRSWVALGDPVGSKAEALELVWQFRLFCDRHGGWPVFYDVGKQSLYLYSDIGLVFTKIGEEARVRLSDFALEGGAFKELRHTVRHIEKEGYTFEIIPPSEAQALLPELKRISDSWLAVKNTKEKGFSLGFFNEEYLKRFPFALVRGKGKIVAFANVWPTAEKEELSVDLMRYFVEEAPKGVMDYLFVQMMLWGRNEGFRWFTLGVVPLAGLEDRALAPWWNRFGAFLFRHGEHFYNFQGLRQYKDKFMPIWEPKYLASPGGLVLPRVLTDVASLISGGLKGMITK